MMYVDLNECKMSIRMKFLFDYFISDLIGLMNVFAPIFERYEENIFE